VAGNWKFKAIFIEEIKLGIKIFPVSSCPET
jgi:hypothetical protein